MLNGIQEGKETTAWYREGALHREDGPAVVWRNGARNEWYLNNERHREDGPCSRRPKRLQRVVG